MMRLHHTCQVPGQLAQLSVVQIKKGSEPDECGADLLPFIAPPCDLAFTRYCLHQYCMVYGIQKEGRWEGVYCAMVVQ